MKKIVILGAGAAGYFTAKRLKQNDPGMEVDLFDSESKGFYAKMRLPEYLSGALPFEKLILASGDKMESAGIRAHLGESVRKIDLKQHCVESSVGTVCSYDALVFATGADAFVPPIPGLAGNPRVQTLRTLADASAVAGLAAGAKEVLVMGGGLLGLEAAWALHSRGLKVSILECADRLLPRQLFPEESARLEQVFEENGFQIHTGVSLASLVNLENGRLQARLADNGELETDFLLVSAGIRPNTALAKAAGLPVERGIVVTESLAVSGIPSVYALGDCAQIGGVIPGLWSAAKDQAEALGDILCGKREHFELPVYSPVLKISGIDFSRIRSPRNS